MKYWLSCSRGKKSFSSFEAAIEMIEFFFGDGFTVVPPQLIPRRWIIVVDETNEEFHLVLE